MQFRRLTLDVQPIRLAGVILASFCIFVPGNLFAEPIQVVPANGSTISTNINQDEGQAAPRKDFEAMTPAAPRPLMPEDSMQGLAPTMMPPPPARTLTPREKELLDRRRNWVFMTPEELMSNPSTEEMLGLKQYDKDGVERDPTTAMERYYERLIASSRHMATNQWDRDSDSWMKMTNGMTTGIGEQNDDNARAFDNPFNSPFNSSPTPGVFQPMRPNTFSDVFGTGPDTTMATPEMVQSEKEEKAHMDSFKQMWDIGQPSTPAAVSASSSGGFSTSGSGAFPSLQPVLSTATPSLSGSSAQPNSTSSQPRPTSLHTTPPRPNFTIPQRQF